MNIYKWLWSRIGGRPWTYIIRDWWVDYEGLWIIGFVAIGALLGHWLWELIFWFLGVFALGFVAGHLFWGTKQVYGQKGNPNPGVIARRRRSNPIQSYNNRR